MISERDIAEKFSFVWKQSFPLLTPNFMKLFNETYVESINLHPAFVTNDVRYDLVSEAAFNLSQLVIENGVAPEDYVSEIGNLRDLVEKTGKSIWSRDWQYGKETELTPDEVKDIIKICKNTVEFINKVKIDKIIFRPKMKGYGIIPYLHGDLEIDDTLFEIKTVTRNFKSTDLKQLFMYLALKQAEGKINWTYAGLYNPRKGIYATFNVVNLINNITGGTSPNEAFDTLLNNLVRDIDLDARF